MAKDIRTLYICGFIFYKTWFKEELFLVLEQMLAVYIICKYSLVLTIRKVHSQIK
jgi:hypothetical protein